MSILPSRSVAALLTFFVTFAANGQQIDTRGSHDVDVQTNFGIAGESFVTPGGLGTLNSFSVFLRATVDDPYSFRTLIYRFGGSSPIGNALFMSAFREAPITQFNRDFVRELFSPVSLVLVPNAQYIAMIQREGDGPLLLELSNDDPSTPFPQIGSTYSGGQFYAGYHYSGDPTTAFYQTDLFADGSDIGFSATFSETSAPEPAVLGYVALGLLALLPAAHRRCRRRV